MGLKERAKRLATDIPAVFIALQKKETPVMAKILAGITVGYALSPLDLIPDFIPVLGYLDDVLLLPCFIALTVRLIPKDLFAACQKEAEGLWAQGKPKKWRYALPIVFVWLLLLFFILKAILFSN
ncbi:MAG: DUF1232 domain-containing protein [Christensenellaceae bacterium]|jgi:uncharacterized membrane protein YkvA (DUF1232 family)|nr:DUF1232 domain-containing protein [Christensenellaceae bacterium]